MEAAIFASVIIQFIDFFKELADFKNNKAPVITQALAWVGGIVLIVIAAHASAVSGLVLPGFTDTIGSFDGGSQILAGIAVASVGSTIVDFKQAFDNTDSAAKPALVGPNPPAGP